MKQIQLRNVETEADLRCVREVFSWFGTTPLSHFRHPKGIEPESYPISSSVSGSRTGSSFAVDMTIS